MNYRLAYKIGFHPWEDLAEHPPFATKLLDWWRARRTERAAIRSGARPRLRQRGLGCPARAAWLGGTGVDIVEKALHRAGERVEEAGVEMRLVHGDVTALRQSDVGSGFRLVLDTGTFHGLADAQREAMGREVTAIAPPKRRCCSTASPRAAEGRCPAARAAPTWSGHSPGGITDVEIADTEPDALARLFRFDERFYRLRRRSKT